MPNDHRHLGKRFALRVPSGHVRKSEAWLERRSAAMPARVHHLLKGDIQSEEGDALLAGMYALGKKPTLVRIFLDWDTFGSCARAHFLRGPRKYPPVGQLGKKAAGSEDSAEPERFASLAQQTAAPAVHPRAYTFSWPDVEPQPVLCMTHWCLLHGEKQNGRFWC